LVEDENGFIWASTDIDDGLICFNPMNEQFKRFNHDPIKQSSLSSNAVWSVYKDQSGILWVGTGWAGLNKWDRNKYKFKHYNYDPADPYKNSFSTIYTLIEDRDGIIWFGTDNGLNSFNRLTNEFKNYKYTVTHIY
jgi:ligand-binding sensor domain-containing protein